MTALLHARLDPALRATLDHVRPLFYGDGGAPSEDRPAHVRAASALRWSGSRLLIIQDDSHVLVLRDADGPTGHVLLEAAEGGVRVFDDVRGNKHLKMDLEACVSLPDGRLVALGSGSTAARERLVLLEPGGAVRVVDGSALYTQLRSTLEFAGSELNVEGALVVGSRLRLFQRGNGAAQAGLKPVNATVDLELAAFLRFLAGAGPVPGLHDIVQYDLGQVAGIPFGFTDATLTHDGRVAFVACVEASPDTVRDGEVLGCRFGVCTGPDVRMTDVLDASGRPTRLKLEGIEARPGEDLLFDVVADMDAPDEPALLATLNVQGLEAGAP